jgi:hypothetical protein
LQSGKSANYRFGSIISHLVIDMEETRPQTVVCYQFSAIIFEHELRLNRFAHAAFVLGNRRKDRIKIPGWSRNSFVIH